MKGKRIQIMKTEIMEQYKLWCEKATEDADVKAELEAIASDEAKIEDAFYRNLEFGTGGLRGVIGAGTNRMNIYTVAKASQGLANYVVNNFEEGKRSIAVSYDSRIKSDLFAQIAAGIMVTASHNPSKYNGYKVYGADGCQITTKAAEIILAEIEKIDLFADVKRGDFKTLLDEGKISYIDEQIYTDFTEEVKKQSLLGDADEIDKFGTENC